MNITDYTGAVSYISSIPRFADKNDFTNMKAFYEYMDKELSLENKENKVFHVAGTNGKGSTCAYLASVSRAMGKRTGVFTSPHLTDICERIVVDDKQIEEQEFFAAFKKVYDLLGQFKAQEAYSSYIPTYFAWLFFIAAVAFKRAGAEVIIWETGLGGRLDATNVIVHKSISIITEIGFDHMEYLGDTIEKIATEKAGIIKAGVPVVATFREVASKKVIEKMALEQNAYCIFVKKPVEIKVNEAGRAIDFCYKSRYYSSADFEINTIAEYQTENATLALSALEQVYTKAELSLEKLRLGLLNMKWQGRMEEIEPGVIFDGAHNVDGITAFLKSVNNMENKGKKYLLFSAVTDKQADKMLKLINASGLFYKIVLAHMDNERGIDDDTLEKLKNQLANFENIEIYNDAFVAYEILKKDMQKSDYLFVCGSLYLIGELKRRIKEND